MTASDYNRIGQLRIEKDRLLARVALLETVGDAMAHRLDDRAKQEWADAKAWDGCPQNDRTSTHRYYRGQV